SGVVDVCLWSALLSEVTGETTFNTVQHLVADTDVCKCPANHDFVVTAAGSVGVEVLTCHTVFNKVPACWSVRFERPCRRDVVGSYRITEFEQDPCTSNIFNWCSFEGHAFKVGRFPHID